MYWYTVEKAVFVLGGVGSNWSEGLHSWQMKVSVSACTGCSLKGFVGRTVPSESYDKRLVKTLVMGLGVTLENIDVNSLRMRERYV